MHKKPKLTTLNITLLTAYLSIFFLVSCKDSLMSSEPYQKISLLGGDTITEFHITGQEIKPVSTKTYTWYFKNKINTTQGGYHGHLLDGEYVVLDKEGIPKLKGVYKEGLKDGQWLRWSESHLIERETYKDGVRSGKYEQFDGQELTESGKYVDGKKQGKVTIPVADTLHYEINYEKGVPVDTTYVNPIQ